MKALVSNTSVVFENARVEKCLVATCSEVRKPPRVSECVLETLVFRSLRVFALLRARPLVFRPPFPSAEYYVPTSQSNKRPKTSKI